MQWRIFLPLLIHNTVKFLDPKGNQTDQLVWSLAGMSQEHDRLGRYILSRGKTWGGESGICVSQGDIEEAGDVVAILL